MCSSAAAISASSRGSLKKLRQPMSSARVPPVAAAPALSGANRIRGGVGSGGARVRGAEMTGGEQRQRRTRQGPPAHACAARDRSESRPAHAPAPARSPRDGRRPLATHPPPHREVEERNEEDADGRGEEHSGKHASADRMPARRAGARREHQRQHAKDERERRHENRPQPLRAPPPSPLRECSCPWARSSLANSTIRIAFFAASPTTVIRPTWK